MFARFIVIQFHDREHFVGVFDRERQRTVFSRRVTEYGAHQRVVQECFDLNARAQGYVKAAG